MTKERHQRPIIPVCSTRAKPKVAAHAGPRCNAIVVPHGSACCPTQPLVGRGVPTAPRASEGARNVRDWTTCGARWSWANSFPWAEAAWLPSAHRYAMLSSLTAKGSMRMSCFHRTLFAPVSNCRPAQASLTAGGLHPLRREYNRVGVNVRFDPC
jgi:hypothetical protein